MDRFLSLQLWRRSGSQWYVVTLARIDDSGLYIIVPLLIQNILQDLLYGDIPDGHQNFDSIIDVARHQVS